jgi:murein DD-endopeptidase MepM/ murein hydrolase activator NlpD
MMGILRFFRSIINCDQKISPVVLMLFLIFLSSCTNSTKTISSSEISDSGKDIKVNSGYVVKSGDNIYGIARQLNISPRALIEANGLTPPFKLIPGTTLILPGDSTYLVTKGDTLLGVARKVSVPFSTLARLNNLSPPYPLIPGQKLTLPAHKNTPQAQANDKVEISSDQQALRPSVSSTNLPSPPKVVSVALPPLPPTNVPGNEIKNEKETYLKSDKNLNSPSSELMNDKPISLSQTAIASPVTLPSGSGSKKTPVSLKGFLWPVKGNIIQPFGPNGKGVHNDGINIAVPRGTAIKASEEGIVAYSGNELRGFGNLLLIKHSNGWMSAYAHNDELLVKRGDTVHRGQVIAKSGSSGGVNQPQLHFELRQGTKPIDPEGILGKSTKGIDQGDQQYPG